MWRKLLYLFCMSSSWVSNLNGLLTSVVFHNLQKCIARYSGITMN
nr:hypothetical protein Iba_chr05aCG14100 [Ipomoea batatas]GMC94144.1 hypothetical protein Iba_chr05bCG9070 [Ipomoea batatas]GMC96048.1 hypothetical protein Iba_chr05cCG14410 [Ipomoea batatas]GMD67970.1 hypothetical protein Iba_scaffold49942CG0010 [Ipomoea batatas]GME14126.1 hypothetical protein Iba_scaffold14950CG0010 [Ipomoea batatas]